MDRPLVGDTIVSNASIAILSYLVHQSVTGVVALRSKWAAGKAVRAGLALRRSISRSIRDRGATQPPAYFHRNPPGCAPFDRLLCRSSVKDHSGYSPSSGAASASLVRATRATGDQQCVSRALSCARLPRRACPARELPSASTGRFYRGTVSQALRAPARRAMPKRGWRTQPRVSPGFNSEERRLGRTRLF